MIEQAGLSIAISEGAGLRIADCPETFSPAVNLALIFIISFSTHLAGEMQGLRTVHISGVFHHTLVLRGSKEVVHTFSSCAVYQVESRMEVTNFLLTQAGLRHRMSLTYTHCAIL
jgi:predicted alpha/beta-hydrolase family hydrolase